MQRVKRAAKESIAISTAQGDSMASTFQQAKLAALAALAPSAAAGRKEDFQQVYEQNRHRIYSLSFWATDNELAAEELMTNAFYRAFVKSATPDSEAVDRAFLAEVRELMP